jgi:hypothetical protein
MEDIFFDLKPINSAFEKAKDVLIIMKMSDSSEQNMVFLSKILAALKLEINDCDILRIENATMVGKMLRDYKKVLVFGIYPDILGLNIEISPYRVFYLEDSSILFAHGLQKLISEVELKNTLWKCLQLMFQINQVK